MFCSFCSHKDFGEGCGERDQETLKRDDTTLRVLTGRESENLSGTDLPLVSNAMSPLRIQTGIHLWGLNPWA